ncbi:hypothetical protein GCM10028857_16560 [Salinarchaeum chitinilyticum]
MVGKKAMLFVDAQNLTFGAKNFGKDRDSEYRVDAVALQEELAAQRDLIRGYWFDAFYTQGQIEQAAEDGKDLSDKQGFFRFLRRNGYRVDAKPLRERDGTFVAKGDDIGLATELIAQGFNDSYEVAIVVTGDADFERPIRYVQNEGKIVEVASFESQISGDLKSVADEYTALEEVADAIELDDSGKGN